MTGPATSSSMYSSSASIAEALVAARVDDKPFSAMEATVCPRVLVQFSLPPNFRNAHSALIPSCCAATLESATAPFQRLESCRKGRKAGSYSSGVASNCFAASSYACFRTFHIYSTVSDGTRRDSTGKPWERRYTCLVHETVHQRQGTVIFLLICHRAGLVSGRRAEVF